MGWTGCVHFEKFHRNFMVQTFALTAPVQPSLHKVLCGNETTQNAPKPHETHQNLRIWSNGVDRVQSLQKILTRLHGTNFFTNCTRSAQIALVLYSNKMILNALKPYETHQNMSLGPMGWTRCVRYKNVQCDFVSRTFASIATVRPVLHRVWCSNEMITNAAKHYETHKTMSLGSNGLDRVRSFLKIPSQLHGTNFCTNCTSSAQFAPCFMW